MSKLEYTSCIDSNNRDMEIFPEPNNCRIDLNMAQQRMPVQQMYLGSIELPLSQWTIEEDWQNLYFDEGIRIVVNDAADLELRTLRLQIGNMITEAILPIWLNAIIDVDDTDPTKPIFTTMMPHALDLRDQWTFDPIVLISTPLTDPALVELTGTNPNLIILSDTEFQLCSVVPVPWVASDGIFGYVHAPTVPDPTTLAQIITRAFAVDGVSVDVTFDPDTNCFVLSFSSNEPVTLFNTGCHTLAHLLGFGFASMCLSGTGQENTSLVLQQGGSNVNSPMPFAQPDGACSSIAGPFTSATAAQDRTIVGSYKYNCASRATLVPGNYTAAGLGTEVSMQMNRFWLDPGCGMAPDQHFIFSNACGACIDVVVPPGMWSPDTLAQFLESRMTALNALGTVFEVTWSLADDQFCFTSVDGSPFGLEFDDANNTIAWRIGFDSICYRGSNSYKSTRPLNVPVLGCGGTTMPDRYTSNVYVPVVRTAQRRFEFSVCSNRCMPGVLDDNGDGTATIVTTIAHGYQPEDVIVLTQPLPTHKLRVVEVVDGFTFIVEIGSAPLVGVMGENVCVCNTAEPMLNLYFAPGTGPDIIRPCIMGFGDTAAQWSLDGPTLIAPHSFQVDHPNYLLVQITEPTGSTYIQHSWKNDNLTDVFAKLVIYPPYRLERIYPMQKILQGIEIVDHIFIRILNPDHSLYHFHGRNWSATIVFVVPQLTGSQLCF